VIELTTFRLRAGIDEADFVAADAAAQTGFFYRQPGLVRRTTARPSGADDEWLIVTWWASADAADCAAAALADGAANEAARAYLDCLDGPVVRRYEPLAG
jgi:heme-degrading monooxygenase HmoA